MGSKGQQVGLMSLDVQQLLEVKKQLETEVQHLTSSFGQLKAAQAKFKSCIDSVASVKPENKDKTTLIPLTSSLYVPGKLADSENVIVDVGTGYFVEKSTTDATKMYQEKVEFLTKDLEQLQETVLRQQENLQTTVEMIRMQKARAEQQAAASAQGRGAATAAAPS
ncbi:probable prefoldin subunit 5 [Ustilago bromivora]|uniref:Probable prefoldin subunit 5 n=1 Tax=Ustilago bromivora TaxID=307758 RepID=A0A1K0FZF2_9BASI|nr:probable prefoldin subunit 5 [Ustilago bromivora]